MSDASKLQFQEPCEKCGLSADAAWCSNLCPYCGHALGVEPSQKAACSAGSGTEPREDRGPMTRPYCDMCYDESWSAPNANGDHEMLPMRDAMARCGRLPSAPQKGGETAEAEARHFAAGVARHYRSGAYRCLHRETITGLGVDCEECFVDLLRDYAREVEREHDTLRAALASYEEQDEKQTQALEKQLIQVERERDRLRDQVDDLAARVDSRIVAAMVTITVLVWVVFL